MTSLPTPTETRTGLNMSLKGIIACGHQNGVSRKFVQICARRQHIVNALKRLALDKSLHLRLP